MPSIRSCIRWSIKVQRISRCATRKRCYRPIRFEKLEERLLLSTGSLDLARYNADGSLDLKFGTGGQVTTDLGASNQAIKGLVLEPDGKLVAARGGPEDLQ
jgi:hypothetical protein